MQQGLDLSDIFIVLFIGIVFSLGAYTLIKFMRNKN